MALGADGRIWIGTSNGVLVYSETTDVHEECSLNPTGYNIISNFPNPFNPSTIITFFLPMPEQVKLVVYSITGRKVAILADTKMNAGQHSIEFDGFNLATGVYVARLETKRSLITRKMLLIK
jgi:ligand-binding sensor domain-containing protein